MAMTPTTNYSLRKRDAGDLNWDTDVNYNWDLLDSLFHTHEGQQLNPADTDTTKNKHLSNAQAKVWQDHVGAKNNPHEVTAEQTGALPFLVGTTLERPEEPEVGYMYFDTDLGYPVWWDGAEWGGTPPGGGGGGSGIKYINIPIDGVGSAIGVGLLPLSIVLPPGVIKEVQLLADQTGSIKVDIWKSSFADYPPVDADSICGGNEPEISSGIKFADSTLTDWGTTITAGDVFRVYVDSCSDIEFCTLIIKVEES